MSYDGYNNWGGNPTANESYNFDMPEQFGQELNFQSFETSQAQYENQGAPQQQQQQFQQPQQPYGQTYLDPTMNSPYSGDIFNPAQAPLMDQKYESTGNEFEDEPPLLEELGINPHAIFQKTLSVLNPFRTTEQSILQDTDLAGPLVFCLALGGFLLLRGKMSFSYIYGIGVLGCLAFYALLSLMAPSVKVTLGAVISVLGYCLLPMVVLSGINVLITIQGVLGTILSVICILWCATSSSKLFVTAYSMDHQQILVAYPCALIYGVFALITIF